MTKLAEGNRALREKKFEAAISCYLQSLQATPALGKIIAENLSMARQKYRDDRAKTERLRVAVCGWDLAHNAAGRVYTLAKLYETFADVEIIGSIFPGFGREIWEPIRNTTLPIHPFVVDDESRFLDQAIELVAAHPYDIVHLSKPRAPNIFFGILYKLIWEAKVLVDIDDEELAFVEAETPITIDDYLKIHGKLPELKELDGKDWTRLAVGLAKDFDGITVSNPALQQRYGGEIIRHARDEKLYQPSPELKRKSREKFGIPQDKKVVLFFGTPREHKGLLETADAIQSLNRDDVTFAIIGDFDFRESGLKEQLLKKTGVDYFFLGSQPFEKIQDIVAVGDYCVLLQDPSSPATQFQSPAKLSDALGMGLVVFANNMPPLYDVALLGAFVTITSDKLAQVLKETINDQNLERQASGTGRIAFAAELSFTANAPRLRAVLGKVDQTAIGKADETNQFGVLLEGTHLSFILTLLNGYKPQSSNQHKTQHGQENSLFVEHSSWQASVAKQVTSNQFAEHVDIVVPVFNALEDVQKCLSSLQTHKDGFVVRVIVVNDGSDEATTLWLRHFCGLDPMFKLIEHEKNRGYTCAVNTGLKASTAPYAITQNSDTIVTCGWLKGLVRCISSDPKIGIVGPLSNAASWQNIPELYDSARRFAVNELPEGMKAGDIAEIIARSSKRRYPRMPFVNGFCFMIKREVINLLGYMDEENFPVGYGEENDYCIRTADAGFCLAIADDAYVYHAKSKSFGHERRQELSKQGEEALKRKHSPEKFASFLSKLKQVQDLDNIRNEFRLNLANWKKQTTGINVFALEILFLLPVGGEGGGIHSVVQEVAEMRRLGMSAKIAIRIQNKDEYYRNYKDIYGFEELFETYDSPNHLCFLSQYYNIIIATLFSSVELLQKIVAENPQAIPAYYVQDYEPLFFEPGTDYYKTARDSYTLIPDMLLFAKTEWIARQVKKEHGITVHKVSPSIDHDLYKPAPKTKTGKIRLAAMIRPQTPRRGADRTMRVLSRLAKELPSKLEFHLFGCNEDHELFQSLTRDFKYSNYGVLKRPEVAALLSKSDMFIDLSDYQAFGRTALEAMACGCAVVVPEHGGTDEFAINEINSLVVDSLNEDECFDRIKLLLENRIKLLMFQQQSLLTASKFSTHIAAVSELLLFANTVASHSLSVNNQGRRKVTIMPTLMGNGRPAGSAYVRLLCPYSPSLLDRYHITVNNTKKLPDPGSADIAMLQRDMGGISLSDYKNWALDWKEAGGKIVFDIDDDLMDCEAIKKRTGRDDKQAKELAERILCFASTADLVTVSMPWLYNKMKPFTKAIKLIPNYLDEEMWWVARERPNSSDCFKKEQGDPVRIGYIGTPTHDQDLEVVLEAMRRIETEFGKLVEIEIVGAFERRTPMFGKKVGQPKKTEYPHFVEWLGKRIHWDIGIIPLDDDEFNKSKSFLKFLEYSALNLAIVCSNVTTYSSVAKHEINSLVVENNAQSWYEALRDLILHEQKRSFLAKNANKDLHRSYTIQKNKSIYEEALLSLFNKADSTGNRDDA